MKNQAKHLPDFCDRLGYVFKDINLLVLALTHPSYANEHGVSRFVNNQRLEYLGDAVLGLVIGEALYMKYPDVDEGELSRLRSRLVCEDALFLLAQKLRFDEVILLGHASDLLKTRECKGALADAYEAVIAAIYLDGGLEAARQYVLSHHESLLADPDGDWLIADSKSRLQVIAQKDHRIVRYEVEPCEPGSCNSGYRAEVFIDDVCYGKGDGISKQEAQQQAAAEALSRFKNADEMH